MLVSVSPIKVLVVVKKGWAYPSHNAHLRSPCYQPPAPTTPSNRSLRSYRPGSPAGLGRCRPQWQRATTAEEPDVSLSRDLRKITRTARQAVRVCRMRKSDGCLGFFVPTRSATLTSSTSRNCSVGVCTGPKAPPVLQDGEFVVCQEGLQSFAARCLGERVWSIVRVDTGKDFE
jgi:hypothetical protein